MSGAQTITCRISGSRFLLTEEEESLIQKINAANPHLKSPLPLPTVSPVEQVRRLHLFGNFYYLYRARSALSGKPQLTRFNPERGLKISTLDEFWSDAIDNRSVGARVDFSRSFFEQWNELLHRAYLIPFNNNMTEGSDYVSGANNVKNCYLCFSILDSQDCLYCLHQYRGNDNLYCTGSDHSNFCYGCIDIDGCYECQECQDSFNCRECWFCSDCRACSECFGCIGLTQAKYCIYNKQVTKEEYHSFLKAGSLGSRNARTAIREKVSALANDIGHIPKRLINSENCTGAYIRRSKNLLNCYHSEESEDCGYIIVCHSSNDCWRGYAVNSELTYTAGTINGYNSHFSYGLWGGENLWYSFFLFNNCSDCFGCIGLKGAHYCILNQQYSREEYYEILPRVVALMKKHGEWGEMLPPSCAPHPYYESAALTLIEELPSDELIRRGYDTTMPPSSLAESQATSGNELPDLIYDCLEESILNRTYSCPETGLPFAFQKKEVEFYKRFNIPVPNTHWRSKIVKMNGLRAKLSEPQ